MVAHEVHSVLYVLEYFEFNKDEVQAHAHCQIGYELPQGGCYIILEKAPDLIAIDPSTRIMEGS